SARAPRRHARRPAVARRPSRARARGCPSAQPRMDPLESVWEDEVVRPHGSALAAEDLRRGEDLQVLGQRLLAHWKQRRELALTYGLRRRLAQRVDDLQARRVRQGLDHPGHLGGVSSRQIGLDERLTKAATVPGAWSQDRELSRWHWPNCTQLLGCS